MITRVRRFISELPDSLYRPIYRCRSCGFTHRGKWWERGNYCYDIVCAECQAGRDRYKSVSAPPEDTQ